MDKVKFQDTITLMTFLGYEHVRIDYYGTKDETEWQRNNEEWIEKMEIESIGDYLVDVKNDDFYCLDSGVAGQKRLKENSFKKDWNLLMKVIKKLQQTDKELIITTDIETMYLVCLDRVKKL